MRKIAIGLWAAQAVTSVVMLAAALSEIESIVVFGPLLSVFGLALAAVTLHLKSWDAIAFALSGPLVCALGATLIVVCDWGPNSAERPIRILLVAYVLTAIPLAVLSLREILRWQPSVLPQQPRVWQFSMKSLLLCMTAVCVFATASQFIPAKLTSDTLRGERLGFAVFALTEIVLCGAVVWLFLTNRRWPGASEPRDRADG